MRVVLIAPPGSGKGTQALRIVERYGITHISSGDMFREEMAGDTWVGRRVREFVESGDLVPDDMVLEMVAPRVIAAAEAGGYVLDGFPRTLSQAQVAQELAADWGVSAHVVLWLQADEAELVRRLTRRSAAEGRRDDEEEVVRHRLAVFHEKTEPLLEFYEDRGLLARVDAMGTMDEVSERVFGTLDAFRDAPDF